MTNTGDLSDRELEILKMVATGVSNKEIAVKLHISTNTVKVHLRNIFAKIKVLSRTEATLFAIEHGIVVSPRNSEIPAPNSQASGVFRNFRWVTIGGIAIVLIGLTIAIYRLIQPGISPVATTQALSTNPTAITRLQRIASLPQGRNGMASCVYEDNIFIFSGESAGGINGSSYKYEIRTDRWESIAEKPTAVRDIQAALIGEKIYVPGGWSDQSATTDLEVYDPRTDTWESMSPMPRASSAYALATLEGKLYLFGGWNGDHFLDDVLIYNPDVDGWEQGASLPTARAYASAGVANGRIYVIGGMDETGTLGINEAYTPNRDRAGDSPWTTQPALPEGQELSGLQSIGDIIFTISGDGLGNASIYQFIPQNDVWELFDDTSNLPTTVHAALAAHQGFLYFIGGSETDGVLSGDVERYQVIYTIFIPVLNN
jgi:DNA-binding CsgD family transcriptional regulator